MKFFRSDKDIEAVVSSHLTEKLGTRVKVFKSATLGGGCINNASVIETSEGKFFLKWNADCASDMFLREAEGLTELRKAAGDSLVVPDVVVAKEVDSTPGFIVLEYLAGSSSHGDADERLGHGLAKIHQYRNDKFGFYNNNYCGATMQDNNWSRSWPLFFRDNRLKFLLGLIQKDRPLPAGDVSMYHRLLDKIDRLVPEKSDPVLIHGDLWSGNYMMTTRGPALIDPAAYYADREMEMGIMTMFGGFSSRFYSAYNEINPLPSDWRERNRLYQLYHVLNHYYLFGGSYGRQAAQIAQSYL